MPSAEFSRVITPAAGRARPRDCPRSDWRPPACRTPSIPAAHWPNPHEMTTAPRRRRRHTTAAIRHAGGHPEAAPDRRRPAAGSKRVRRVPLGPFADDDQVEVRQLGHRLDGAVVAFALDQQANGNQRRPGETRAARAAARSAGGRNSAVSTPLRSTVIFASGAPISTSA